MKARTCPHCNYQYSKIEYFKLQFMKFTFSEWKCKNCKREISYNFKRRAFVALFSGFWFILLYYIKSSLEMTPLIWVVLLVSLVFGQGLIFTFEAFKKVDGE